MICLEIMFNSLTGYIRNVIPYTTVDFRSTGPHENVCFDVTQKTSSDRLSEPPDDQQSSGASDTIVPDVLDDDDDMIVENESPRAGQYNLRPNPTPNFADQYRY